MSTWWCACSIARRTRIRLTPHFAAAAAWRGPGSLPSVQKLSALQAASDEERKRLEAAYRDRIATYDEKLREVRARHGCMRACMRGAAWGRRGCGRPAPHAIRRAGAKGW